jgi:hypothetical protein
MEFPDMTEFSSFILGFGFNFLIAFLVVRFIYYPSTHNKRYVFTYLAFNTLIFFVLSFMSAINIGLGVGFGLFAIFHILRYRTDPVPIREMTYLFIISALPLMNSAAASGKVWPQLVVANLAVLAILWILEKEWGFHYEASKRIIYEKIDLIRSDKRPELLADLESRTGLKVKRILVGKVDFLHDTAELKIYYDDPSQDAWLNNSDPEMVIIKEE